MVESKRVMPERVEEIQRMIVDLGIEIPLTDLNKENLIKESILRWIIDRRYAKQIVEIAENRLFNLNRLPNLRLSNTELEAKQRLSCNKHTAKDHKETVTEILARLDQIERE